LYRIEAGRDELAIDCRMGDLGFRGAEMLRGKEKVSDWFSPSNHLYMSGTHSYGRRAGRA